MSGLKKYFKTSVEKEVEGAEIELPEAQNDDGTIPVFILSRTAKSNKAYSKALEAATRPYRRQIELGTMSKELADSLFKGVFVNTVIKGWRNVQDDKGKEIAFSPEAALAILSEEGMDDLYERLQQEAGTLSNFRDVALEEEAKN